MPILTFNNTLRAPLITQRQLIFHVDNQLIIKDKMLILIVIRSALNVCMHQLYKPLAYYPNLLSKMANHLRFLKNNRILL